MHTNVEQGARAHTTVYPILIAISVGHLLNDAMQAVIPALFPILVASMDLSYTQIGWNAFTLNMTSSILQPTVGLFTDRHLSPYFLPLGMAASLLGMAGLAFAPDFLFVLLSVLLVGLGSAVFHPEGARVVYFAAGAERNGDLPNRFTKSAEILEMPSLRCLQSLFLFRSDKKEPVGSRLWQ